MFDAQNQPANDLGLEAAEDEIVTGVDLDDILGLDTSTVTHRVSVIDDVNGKPKSGFVIVGRNSPQFIEANTNLRVENIQRGAIRAKPLDTKTPQGAKTLTKTVDRNDMRTAVAVVVDWFGWERNKEPIPFDRATVEAMLTKYPTWKTKIAAALDNEANFIKV